MKLPIYKYLDLSTAHISPKTDEYLKRESKDELSTLIIYKKERGYFIHVPEDLKFIRRYIPRDLGECLALAEKHECNWLVLDGDAEVIDGLETYKW